MVLAMMVGGWLFLPGSRLAWMLFALSPYLISIVTNLIAEIHRVFSRQPASVTTHPLRLAALRALFEIIFLPHESLIILDAIGTTLLRMSATKKRLPRRWSASQPTLDSSNGRN